MNVLKTILTLLIVGIASAFGIVLTPDSAPAVFAWLAGLSPSVQVGIAVGLGLLIIVPLIAPYTPWTWDDRTIKYKTGAQKILAEIWNDLAGNFGKARNGK